MYGAFILFGPREMAIVVGRSDPHVPHQQREAEHHRSDTPRSTKFDVPAIIDFRVFL